MSLGLRQTSYPSTFALYRHYTMTLDHDFWEFLDLKVDEGAEVGAVKNILLHTFSLV